MNRRVNPPGERMIGVLVSNARRINYKIIQTGG